MSLCSLSFSNLVQVLFSCFQRPGPDDFIKEFVEQESFLNDDAEKTYEIPVAEAFECDPSAFSYLLEISSV